MSTPTTSIRVDVRTRLLQLLQDAPGLASVNSDSITYAEPQAELSRDSVWLGEVKGEDPDIPPPTKAGRRVRHDAFTISIFLVTITPGDNDGTASDLRALELLAAVEDIVAENPTLGAVPGLMFCHLRPHDGPNPVGIDTGYASAIQVPLFCLTQLR